MKIHSLFLIASFLISASPTSTSARAPIPDSPGKVFDLAWVGKMTRVSDPQIAPDGKSLVTVVTKSDYENDLNVSELALVDISSGATRFITHGRKNAGFPRWSPNGDRVAFLAADGDKHNQIFVLDMTGGDAFQVTKSPTSIQQFAWQPDGSALAYAAIDEAPKKTGADKFDDAFEVGNGSFLDREKALPTHLWLVSAAGGEAKRLTSGTCAWRPRIQETAATPRRRYWISPREDPSPSRRIRCLRHFQSPRRTANTSPISTPAMAPTVIIRMFLWWTD
jgi:dipeptidyl aminopeptidase/acylaminoacyl peptidase